MQLLLKEGTFMSKILPKHLTINHLDKMDCKIEISCNYCMTNSTIFAIESRMTSRASTKKEIVVCTRISDGVFLFQ